MGGWVKLHRKITDWEWYQDANVMRLLIHLILTVNYEPKKWQGITIQPGQIVQNNEQLEKRLKLTRKQLRRCLEVLDNSNVVARSRAGRFYLLTLVNWESYQVLDPDEGKAKGNQEGKAKGNRLKNINKYLSNDSDLAYASEAEFLADWKQARETYDKMPTNVAKLTTFERLNFNKVNSQYSLEQIRYAIEGLFRQKGMFPASRLRPAHFLEEGNVDKYLDCYHNKTQLFA